MEQTLMIYKQQCEEQEQIIKEKEDEEKREIETIKEKEDQLEQKKQEWEKVIRNYKQKITELEEQIQLDKEWEIGLEPIRSIGKQRKDKLE